MNEITIAIIIFVVTGIVGYIGKLVWDMICARNKDHNLMRELPDIFKRHADEHKSINLNQTILMRSNLSQIKNTLVDKYNQSMERGYITPYELDAWHQMFDSYTELGGNGFVEAIKEQIDELPTRKE